MSPALLAVATAVIVLPTVIAIYLFHELRLRDRDNEDLRDANADAALTIREQFAQIKDLRESLEQAGDALVFWAGWHDEAIARDHERLQRVHDARAFGEAEA